MVHVLQTTLNLVILSSYFAEPDWQTNLPRFITYVHSNCTAKLTLRLHERSFKSTRLYPFKTMTKKVFLFWSLNTKTIYPFSRLLLHGREMFCYRRSGDDYTLKRFCFASEVAKRKEVSNFVWTGDEGKLLLRITNEYKVVRSAENVDWESVYQTIHWGILAPNGSNF